MIDGRGYAWTTSKGNLQAMPNPQSSGNLASGVVMDIMATPASPSCPMINYVTINWKNNHWFELSD